MAPSPIVEDWAGQPNTGLIHYREHESKLVKYLRWASDNHKWPLDVFLAVRDIPEQALGRTGELRSFLEEHAENHRASYETNPKWGIKIIAINDPVSITSGLNGSGIEYVIGTSKVIVGGSQLDISAEQGLLLRGIPILEADILLATYPYDAFKTVSAWYGRRYGAIRVSRGYTWDHEEKYKRLSEAWQFITTTRAGIIR